MVLPRLLSRSLRAPYLSHLRRYQSTASRSPTPIEKIIVDNIKSTGPVSVATYMQLCLAHPTHGYYMNSSNPVFGTQGDFITSPEISQVFGELIGIWLLSQWANAGSPSSIRLVELGPGRGTLMDDVLRVLSQLLPSHDPIDVHLVETSQALRAIQKQRLESSRRNIDLQFHHSVSDVPHNPGQYTMLVAHEFFDALPIHILQKKETGWHEVLIDTSHVSQPSISTSTQTTSTNSNSQIISHLRRVLSPTPTAASTLLGLSSPRFRNLPAGTFIEVSPAAFKLARQVGQLVSGRKKPEPLVESEATDLNPELDGVGGCGLIIDYGGDKVYGDSFRAFKQHKIVDVFHQPGECDLTANVDFAYLKEAMADLVTLHGPITQHDFLERMGISLRVDALARSASSGARRTAIRDSAKRLTDRLGMGEEYKVLGMTSAGRMEGLVTAEVWPFEVKEERKLDDCVHVGDKSNCKE